MHTNSYFLFLKNYINEHPDNFVASHETNNPTTPQKIFDTGLRVTHSPYGRKIRNFINENDSIDLDNAFMSTFSVVDIKKIDNEKFFYQSPIAPIIINIPKELLEITAESAVNEYCFKIFCGYGHEERPTGTDRCGNITPIENEKNANVRLLPSYLIAGTFNTQTGVFEENDKYFSKLPEKERNKIKENLTKKYELLSQSQPQ